MIFLSISTVSLTHFVTNTTLFTFTTPTTTRSTQHNTTGQTKVTGVRLQPICLHLFFGQSHCTIETSFSFEVLYQTHLLLVTVVVLLCRLIDDGWRGGSSKLKRSPSQENESLLPFYLRGSRLGWYLGMKIGFKNENYKRGQ